MTKSPDIEDYSTARLKRFEEWRQRHRPRALTITATQSRPLIECFVITKQTDQHLLQKALRKAALDSQTTHSDVVSHARLPFLDTNLPIHDKPGPYAHLYLVRDAFDLPRRNVVWIFDGERDTLQARRGRNIQCAVGEVEDVVQLAVASGCLCRVGEDIESRPWLLWRLWIRLKLWDQMQAL